MKSVSLDSFGAISMYNTQKSRAHVTPATPPPFKNL